MRFGLYASVVAFTVLGSPASSQKPALSWTSQQAETLRHFRALVQIDTSNPPGNEVRIVEYLEKVLASDGIPSTRFALDPNRPNLVARLKGNGSKRPVLLLAHTDVVGVQRDKWPVDPFGAILRDGYVWGRGTTDDKDNLTANLMTFLLIKRSGEALERDVIFLAESGEEADPTGVGIRFMVDRHFDAIDAEFAIAEGNGATIEDGRVRTVQIATTEKVPRRVRLVATGTSGHGSVPRLDNAGDPSRERGGEDRHVGDADAPQRDHADVLREARVDQHARAGGAIQEPARPADVPPLPSDISPSTNRSTIPHLRTSLVPTMLQAGIGPNVIPSTAEAVIDIRILPDEDLPALTAQMSARINDPAVRIEPMPITRPVAPPSPIDFAMYRALEQAALRVYPGDDGSPRA